MLSMEEIPHGVYFLWDKGCSLFPMKVRQVCHLIPVIYNK
ncbi:hypothetical protein LEMLEM_LOCUS22547, partial [Lemmus lemmus]